MSTAAAASEIPNWIKNNAGWWADGQIDDASFLKGIEYLLDNLIIQIPSNQKITSGSGWLQLDKFAYELPKRSGTTEVNVSGKFENWSGSSVSIDITRPDGKIDNLSTRSSTGSFESMYIIKSDFPLGNYQLSANNVRDVQLGVISFKLNAQSDQLEKLVPAWVRNNAGWWADGQIDDSSFVSGLQFLIKEGIIKAQQKRVDKDASFAPGIDENLIMYQTKVPSVVVSKGVFSAIVVHTTHNDYCSTEENKITAAYGKMTEVLLKKTTRENPVQVLAVCMKMDEIKENSYPLTLKELGANRSNIIIFVGDLAANFDSYMIKDALGWWKCEADYSSKWAFKGCGTHIIVVCDECTRDDFPDPKDVTSNGMAILAHELGHHKLFEDNFGRSVWSTSLHNAQYQIDYCNEGNTLSSNICKKLIEPIPIMGKTYSVMNIGFVKSNWKEIDRITEGGEMTNWFNCKKSNYDIGITRICGPGISSAETPSPETSPSETSGLYWGAIVELDKVYYSSEDDVNIVITAPNFNANSNAIEYIGTDTDSRVTITTSEGHLDFYKLKETFPDSGVFTGSVSLKGQYDLSGGTGPWSGKIKADSQDTITIKFTNTYSGKADTATAQAFVEAWSETVPTTSFKKFNDFRQKFTIEYPDDWVLAEGHPDSLATFDDQYEWRTNFQVFLIEDDSLNNRSDSKVLRAIERNQWELCDEYTFAGAGDRKCSDFKAVTADSNVFYTNDNRKVYFVKATYTLEWEDYLPGQEHSIVKIVGLIYDGDHSWEMTVESFEYVFDDHSDKIIQMMKSFSLK